MHEIKNDKLKTGKLKISKLKDGKLETVRLRRNRLKIGGLKSFKLKAGVILCICGTMILQATFVYVRNSKADTVFICAQTAETEIAQEENGTAETIALDLYAQAAVLMDAYTGRVLYGKNISRILPMASTTKIMTCILALEYGNPEDLVEVSAYAASMPQVKLGIKTGEQYYLKDLLYSLMLESHNDAAVAIAEYIAEKYEEENLIDTSENELTDLQEDILDTPPNTVDQTLSEQSGEPRNSQNMEQKNKQKSAASRTVEESKLLVAGFAKLMNQKAQELGCENTYFITPNGLDASTVITGDDGKKQEIQHSTTAEELALIMRYCIMQSCQKEQFIKLTEQQTWTFTDNTGKRTCSCYNHNSYLEINEDAITGKTGFTAKAGYCYVGAVEKDGVYLIGALLACGWPPSKSLKWEDMNTLITYGQEQYQKIEITKLQESGFAYLTKSKQNKRKSDLKKVEAEVEFVPFSLLLGEGEQIHENWYMDHSINTTETGVHAGEYQILVDDDVIWRQPIVVESTAAYP